jgi:hypothetical protein
MHMRAKYLLVTAVAVWVIGISLAHVTLNLGWGSVVSNIGRLLGRREVTLWVGYLPVT